jgi:aspartyl-tRNA(Asn)/glutamyl-tRNA(Gln) amidotransferase subunit B
MPELPEQMRTRFIDELGLPVAEATQICQNPVAAQYFEAVASHLPAGQAKLAANWLMGELAAALNRDNIDLSQCPVSPTELAALLKRILDNTISNKIARDVFAQMWAGPERDADQIIEAKGLKQISDTGAIAALVDQVIDSQPEIVEQYRAGKEKAFNSLVGQVMKLAKGKANPAQVNELLKQRLDR